MIFGNNQIMKNNVGVQDGQYMLISVTIAGTNYLYLSTNFGANWTSPSLLTAAAYGGTVISSDATLIGAAYPGSTKTFRKSIDFGATFSSITLANGTYSCGCISDSGQYIALSGLNGTYIIYSSDYGATWTSANNDKNPYAMCCDSTGQYMFLASANTSSNLGGFWYSTNYGATWTRYSFAGDVAKNIRCSANGQYILATTTTVAYISSDYGANWTAVSTSYIPSGNLHAACVSGTGQYMSIGRYGGYIYNSSDYGATWSSYTALGTKTFLYKGACSYDGKYRLLPCYATNAGMAFSSDFGATWSFSNFSGNVVNDVAVNRMPPV